jgi:hypothetical protein
MRVNSASQTNRDSPRLCRCALIKSKARCSSLVGARRLVAVVVRAEAVEAPVIEAVTKRAVVSRTAVR